VPRIRPAHAPRRAKVGAGAQTPVAPVTEVKPPPAAQPVQETPMPRKSAAELSMAGVVADIDAGMPDYGRPDPPARMAEPAAAVWRDTVRSMKKNFFTSENQALLTRYCNAMGEASRIETELACTDVKDAKHARLIRQLTPLMTSALAYARALRITPKSNLERSESRDPNRHTGPKMWEKYASNDDSDKEIVGVLK